MPELSHEYGGSRVDISDRSKIYGKSKVLDFSISRKISDIPLKTGNVKIKSSKTKKRPNAIREIVLVDIFDMKSTKCSSVFGAAKIISIGESTIRKGAGTGRLIKSRYLAFFSNEFPCDQKLLTFVENAKKRINKSFGILCYDVVTKEKRVYDNTNQIVVEFAISPECVTSALINSHLFQHRYCLFRNDADQAFIYERLDFLAKKRVKKI